MHPGCMKRTRRTHSNKLCNCTLKQRQQKIASFSRQRSGTVGQAVELMRKWCFCCCRNDRIDIRILLLMHTAYCISIYRRKAQLSITLWWVVNLCFCFPYRLCCVCLLCCLMLSILIKQESRMSVC